MCTLSCIVSACIELKFQILELWVLRVSDCTQCVQSESVSACLTHLEIFDYLIFITTPNSLKFSESIGFHPLTPNNSCYKQNVGNKLMQHQINEARGSYEKS